MRGLKLKLIVLFGIACCCVPLVVQAQVSNASYSVTHSYTFSNVTGAPSVALFNYGLSAGAYEPTPGWDWVSRGGQWAIVGVGGFADSARVGTDRPNPQFIDAGATAGVAASVFGWGGLYSASMTSYGSAHAQFWPDMAYANSWMNTRIWAPTTWGLGRIVWRPIISDSVGGSAWAQGTRRRPIRNRDPIYATGLDESGNPLWVESFFDVFLETASGVEWQDTGFKATGLQDPLDLKLNIDMTSPFLSSGGLLNLEIVDGMVTTSNATGIFLGMGIPPVGTNVGNMLELPGLINEFTLDYNLTSHSAEGLLFELSGDGAGEIPEPATLGLLAVCAFSLLAFGALRRRRQASGR